MSDPIIAIMRKQRRSTLAKLRRVQRQSAERKAHIEELEQKIVYLRKRIDYLENPPYPDNSGIW